MKVIARDLAFPEGPVWLPDGSLLVVQLRSQCLTRIWPDGRKTEVARFPGSPNGAAIGPDGACYICDNGGMKWEEVHGVKYPVGQSDDYVGGRIERVDLSTGKVETLYERCGERRLRGPNDLVFDAQGGFWFTDLGKRRPRDMDHGAVFYATVDGSMIREVVFPIVTPNGIGLSPDGKTLYVAETSTGRLWAFDVVGPGELRLQLGPMQPYGGRMIYAPATFGRFDSLAVEARGNVCVATLAQGGISVVSPDGRLLEYVDIEGESAVTNICFGGDDLKKAYITASGRGELIEMDWPRPGLKLNY